MMSRKRPRDDFMSASIKPASKQNQTLAADDAWVWEYERERRAKRRREATAKARVDGDAVLKKAALEVNAIALGSLDKEANRRQREAVLKAHGIKPPKAKSLGLKDYFEKDRKEREAAREQQARVELYGAAAKSNAELADVGRKKKKSRDKTRERDERQQRSVVGDLRAIDGQEGTFRNGTLFVSQHGKSRHRSRTMFDSIDTIKRTDPGARYKRRVATKHKASHKGKRR